MFTEFGRRKTNDIKNTNLIGFTNLETHTYEFWYLLKINEYWYGVNNSGKKFTHEKFNSKEELIEYLKSNNIRDFTQYYLDKKYYNVNGKILFKHTIGYVKNEYEKQFKIKVKYIDDEVI